MVFCSDFGFKKQYAWSRVCVQDPDQPVDVHQVPANCPPGTYYERSKG